MAGRPLLKRFRDISIAKKLYFAVGIMALLIAIELLTLWFAINTLSSVRAFVGGEGLWSKGQKDAVFHLQKYAHTRHDIDYQRFLKFMQVPNGDHKARVELAKPSPDWEVARQGFREGRNHEDDIDGMINLFRRFHTISYIHRAIILWGQADSVIAPLMGIGQQLNEEITSSSPSNARINTLLTEVELINENLTSLEDDFSFTLGEGSRWLENLILKLLFAVALTVEISGLILTISVSRGIQRGLNEILRASKQIGKGDFTVKAKAYSGDELGTLAHSFNQMSEELGQATEQLKKNTRQLEESNDSLKQFAYVASHDLKEPLRKINTFASRLNEEYKEAVDEKGKTYLAKIEQSSVRLQRLIDDILSFSRLNSGGTAFEKTDLNSVVKQVLQDIEVQMARDGGRVNTGKLPTIDANNSQMSQLFQNLISNALKFRKEGGTAVVDITANEVSGAELMSRSNGKVNALFDSYTNGRRDKEKFWRISVKDNGIGFEPQYGERIFEVFQRLNTVAEYEGTGIGLAICKRIVNNHHGVIITESQQGEGANFIVILPTSQVNFKENKTAALPR